jgi:uncharacterized protein YkwD
MPTLGAAVLHPRERTRLRTAAARRDRSWFVTVLTLVLVLGLSAASPAPAEASSSSDAARRAELEFLSLVNIERAKHGVGALAERTDIRTVARTWSATMADRNRLGHNPDYSRQITGWQRVSENVGVGPSVAGLHRAFMESDGHRRNVLDDRVTEVGVGVVIAGGRIWVTLNFRRPSTDPTALPPTLTTFGDVSSTNVHADAIRRIVTARVEPGCTSARFCPTATVTRAQFASMLVRALELPPTTERRFTDTTGPHAADIEALAAAGLTNGCSATTFCPDQRLTRAHLATMLARALKLDPVPPTFTDAPANHAGAIGALTAAGIVKGCTPTTYCPTQTITRAQTASMLAHLLR